MRGHCRKCEYEVYAVSIEDLMNMVAADGGEVSLPERDIFCPVCETPLDLDKRGGNLI